MTIQQATTEEKNTPWAPISRSPDQTPEINTRWLRDHTADHRLVDVRSEAEYVGELGHIVGAELVPLATLADAAAGWDLADSIITICRSGARSGTAARTLESLGFTQVASLAGGMIAWNERRFPIAR